MLSMRLILEPSSAGLSESAWITQTVGACFTLWRYILEDEHTPGIYPQSKSQDPENTMSTQNIAVHLPDGSIREVPAGHDAF